MVKGIFMQRTYMMRLIFTLVVMVAQGIGVCALAADDDGAKSQQALQQMQALQQQQLAKRKETEALLSGAPRRSAATPQQQYKQAEGKDDMGESAFAAMATQLFPLDADQVHRLRQMFESSQAAAAAPAGTPPRPTATSQLVSLAPGSTPPVIRLTQGFVSSVLFLDSTGAAWPIAAYSLGNPEAFNIVWNKKDNMLMIQANKGYTYANMAIRLRGLETPVMLTLIPGQKAVDYRVDMRVPGLGPNAKQPSSIGMPSEVNTQLLSILDGSPPTGGQMLKVEGGDAQAWQVAGKLFLRTRYTVLSPGWMATLSSADGMRVYEMQQTPLVLVSAHGKVIQLKLKGLGSNV